MSRTSRLLAVAVLALALAAPAIAYVCHPDAAGTRSLSLRGHVVGYTLRGSTVTVALRSEGACSVLVWRAAMRATRSDASCAAVARASRPAATGARLAAGGPDRADRLDVLGAGGRVVRSWPLAVRVRPGTAQISGGIATFVLRNGTALWSMRLADGRTGLVAPIRRGDRPLLDASGVAYQDHTYKRESASRTTLKFAPARTLRSALARVGRPLHTGGPIRAFSADGTRVALAVGGGATGCDRIVYWDIPWRSALQVSEERGPTCAGSGASGRIVSVALGGDRAQWVTVHRGRAMLVAADGANCEEWVIRRLSDLGRSVSLTALAADGRTLAFALAGSTRRAEIGRVTGAYRGAVAFHVPDVARGLSADGGRVAVLLRDGTVYVRTASGTPLRSILSPGATSVALSGHTLVTATRHGRLDVYAASTGRQLHSWRLPAGAGRVDLQFGIATVTAGRSVYAIDVANGRTARLAASAGLVGAQIEPIGVVYASSTQRRGTVALVPMSRVERAVRYSR